MKDIAQVQLVLSAIFAFIGYFTLFVSFLVCGHNVFKDLPFHVSATIAGFLGFWLFMFSPVSFIILFPQLFLDIKSSDLNQLVFDIHYLLKQTMFSFILSALGLGVIIGALSEIRPRKSILKTINRKWGLHLREFSYEFAWDGFLRGIKKSGTIKLILDDEEITGRLQNYSVISEPKQLIMQRCHITKRNQLGTKDNESVDNLLITEFDAIKKITAPENSFKKHYHDLNHCSQASYFLVSAVGATLLAVSAIETVNFLSDSSLQYMIYFYAYAALACSALSLLLSYLAVKALKQDFRTIEAAAAFYPALTGLFACIVPLSYWLLVCSLEIFYNDDESSLLFKSTTTGLISIFTAALFASSLMKKGKIEVTLRGLMNRDPESDALVKEIIDQSYLHYDFNRTSHMTIEDMVPVMLVKEIEEWTKIPAENIMKYIAEVSKSITSLTQGYKFMYKEEANIIMKWHQILKNEEPEAIPRDKIFHSN